MAKSNTNLATTDAPKQSASHSASGAPAPTGALKLVCDRTTLADALTLAGSVVASRSPAPALLCVRLVAQGGTLRLQATDGELGIALQLASVEVSHEGESLVPVDKLLQIVRSCDDATLALEADKHTLNVRGQHAKFRIFGYDPKLFPGIRDGEAATEFEVSAAQLRRMITCTLFATSPDTSRYAVNGILLDRTARKLQMVATDGRRLALARGDCSGPADGDGSCVIPGKAMHVLQRLLDDPEATVKVTRERTRASFAVGDSAVLSTALGEGAFPPYRDVIPKEHDKEAVFDAAELAAGVRRAALLTNEESKGVRFSFNKDGLTLISRAPEMGEAEIEVQLVSYSGDPIEVGFNPGYITDCLRISDSTEVHIEMRSPAKAAVVRFGADFTYVVMPVSTT